MRDEPASPSYDELYKAFDTPLMQRLRHEAYGKDIGQHSWATADELEEDITRLKLTPASRLLDLGCGPGGLLTFIAAQVRCRGFGLDSSAAAIASGRARAAAMNVEKLLTLQQADLNDPLPSPNSAFDAVLSVDVILHLRNRESVFQEVARVLAPAGRFLFTDAGVLTGAITDEEIRHRALHGYTQFVPSGLNESALQCSGFRVLEQQDRTASLLKNAAGRLAARLAHRSELEKIESAADFDRRLRYLETVVALSQRGALSRIMYLGELV